MRSKCIWDELIAYHCIANDLETICWYCGYISDHYTVNLVQHLRMILADLVSEYLYTTGLELVMNEVIDPYVISRHRSFLKAISVTLMDRFVPQTNLLSVSMSTLSISGVSTCFHHRVGVVCVVLRYVPYIVFYIRHLTHVHMIVGAMVKSCVLIGMAYH